MSAGREGEDESAARHSMHVSGRQTVSSVGGRECQGHRVQTG